MSGPKDYAPPLRYSINVFDGKLNQLFKFQSQLKSLIVELSNSKISDSEMNIHFDCSSQIGNI